MGKWSDPVSHLRIDRRDVRGIIHLLGSRAPIFGPVLEPLAGQFKPICGGSIPVGVILEEGKKGLRVASHEMVP